MAEEVSNQMIVIDKGEYERWTEDLQELKKMVLVGKDENEERWGKVSRDMEEFKKMILLDKEVFKKLLLLDLEGYKQRMLEAINAQEVGCSL